MRFAIAAMAAAWTIVLADISFVRADYYSSELAFCHQWQTTNPNAAGPYDGFGRIAQEKHQVPIAINSYEKALSIQPNDATAHNNLANLLADSGDFAGASRQYEWLLHNGSVGADPVAVMTNYAQLLGQEAFENHDPAMRDRAHELLEQAITMRPDYAQAHGILGEWNLAFGSREAAIRQFKIALNLRPEWKEIEEMLDNLQKNVATQP
jgi:tetratricopeptide (TPR) repeat protein